MLVNSSCLHDTRPIIYLSWRATSLSAVIHHYLSSSVASINKPKRHYNISEGSEREAAFLVCGKLWDTSSDCYHTELLVLVEVGAYSFLHTSVICGN